MPDDGAAQGRGILVGFDGSDAARDAVGLARVLEPWTGPPVLAVVTSDGARVVADDASVDPPGARPQFVASRLDEAASAHTASAIAVGSTHRGALGRVFPGSVGRRLLSTSSVPIAVAPRGYAEQADAGLYVIGVAFDGSEAARRALRLAEAACLQVADALRVYAVVPSARSTPDPRDRAIRQEPESARETLLTALHATVAKLNPEARALPVTLEGDPVPALISRSFEIDLLVVGSAGHGAMEIALGGSVAGELMDSLACPVLVVPPGDATLP
jgi:nucleotide-binding universal stress UspA family protein